MKPWSSSNQQQPLHIHSDKKQTHSEQVKGNRSARPVYIYNTSCSVGNVTAGTFFFVNELESPALTQYNCVFGSHPCYTGQQGHIHSFIVSQFPPSFLFLSFADHRVRLFSGGTFFRTWPGLRWHARSHGLLPFLTELVLAHSAGQEDGATRPLGMRANLSTALLGYHCLS